SPPIAFTLGTGMTHAAGFFRTAVAACDALGARGLLLTKYPDVIPARLPPRVRHCAFAPFRQLLPLCGAVVHHGGAGTTAAPRATATGAGPARVEPAERMGWSSRPGGWCNWQGWPRGRLSKERAAGLPRRPEVTPENRTGTNGTSFPPACPP